MGIASLVLGIVSIVFTFIPLGKWIGIVLGIVGIILGALARKDPEKRGIATGGLVCSIIGFVLCISTYIACVACAGAVNGLF